ncbi:MAG: SMC family ATPase [Candidatus Bathyarchaeota archaeon]|nr:MAG: SMC family ATPase [Candidatus Bathyarchaeota archaeon]
MRIKAVNLINIRSHGKSRINFEKGFNCLVGGLGTGKSSILYAIDFALFGDPLTRSYNYLLREGEDVGKVSVEFVLNGKTYHVERGLKRREKGIGQDVEHLSFYEGDKLLASMKKEAVEEQLESITGLDKEIFREVIWVRQEHLKELLDIAPRERQKRLDQLFGLSDYEVAWNNMRGVQKEYEGEKKAYEKDFDVLGIEKLETSYHEAVEEFSALENRILELTNRLHNVEKELQKTSTKLQSLEKMRNQTEELLKKEAELQTNITNTEDMCARLANEIQKKTVTVNESGQRLEGFESQLNLQKKQLQEIGFAPSLTIEELKQQLASLDGQMTNIRAEQEVARNETRTSKQRVSNLAAENKCPLCLQLLPEDYKAHMLKHIEEESTEREQRLAELERNVQELQNLRNTLNKAVLNIQSYAPRIKDIKTRVHEEVEAKEKLENEFEEQQSQEKILRTQLEKVRGDITNFDISELEAARKLHETAAEQHLTIKKEIDFSETRKKDVAARIEELHERLERAQQKMKRVKKIDNLLEKVDGIRDAYRGIQPKLRTEFIKILERMVQQVLDNLVGEEGTSLYIRIDKTYTPSIKSREGSEREVSYLSGGERTLVAFAYRFALGQLIMQARTGHGLPMLLLDEPTESLGREDRSVDRLAEAISRLKAIEQIIAVTHNEAFAEKANHVIRLEKEIDLSRIVTEK